jgi:GntR family transcriptional regulator
LPTIRQLAGFLGINRNTVQKAYQELETEGLVECRRGRGCAVVEHPADFARPISAQLLAIIDRAIQEAVDLGVRPDDLATFFYARARQRRDVPLQRRLVFVECEPTVVTNIARSLQEKLGVEVTPVLLGDLREFTREVREKLREAHVVATTFFHIHEVRQLLAKEKKEVVGLIVKPHLEKLIQITQIPPDAPTALVCCSECCAQDMKRSLENAGVKSLDTSLGGIDDPVRLGEMLPASSIVIASDYVADEVRPMLQPDQELITLDYTVLDEGAISLLRPLVTDETVS